MDNARVHPDLKEIASVFAAAGRKAYLVGGAVRDLLRGAVPKDWDLATDAPPEEVMRLFRRVVPTGIKHGTVTVLFKGRQVETTTFRTEAGYSDGRRPDSVAYAATIEEDLSRRDFTMNAAAVELPSGRLVDPFGGRSDIKARVIRCVGDPAERFGEDGLRPLRAARFAAQLGFALDPATEAAIPAALPKTALVAPERVREELMKMLAAPAPSVGLRVMEGTGMLALLLPELAACRGVDQKGAHRFDVLDHLFLSCDGAPEGKPLVRLAALLHDAGKPECAAFSPEGVRTFHRHEEASARIAEAFMLRLRYPTASIQAVRHLVASHMFHYEDGWTDAAVRRFVARVGEACLPDLFDLRLADMYGTSGAVPPPGALAAFRDRIAAVLSAGRALSVKDLAVGGEDLAGIGVPRGPRMGAILAALLESVLDDPAMNEKATLLEVARRMEEARLAGNSG